LRVNCFLENFTNCWEYHDWFVIASIGLVTRFTLPDFQVDGNVEEVSERLKSFVRMGVITL
jgi:hypothetical protein